MAKMIVIDDNIGHGIEVTEEIKQDRDFLFGTGEEYQEIYDEYIQVPFSTLQEARGLGKITPGKYYVFDIDGLYKQAVRIPTDGSKLIAICTIKKIEKDELEDRIQDKSLIYNPETNHIRIIWVKSVINIDNGKIGHGTSPYSKMFDSFATEELQNQVMSDEDRILCVNKIISEFRETKVLDNVINLAELENKIVEILNQKER